MTRCGGGLVPPRRWRRCAVGRVGLVGHGGVGCWHGRLGYSRQARGGRSWRSRRSRFPARGGVQFHWSGVPRGAHRAGPRALCVGGFIPPGRCRRMGDGRPGAPVHSAVVGCQGGEAWARYEAWWRRQRCRGAARARRWGRAVIPACASAMDLALTTGRQTLCGGVAAACDNSKVVVGSRLCLDRWGKGGEVPLPVVRGAGPWCLKADGGPGTAGRTGRVWALSRQTPRQREGAAPWG